MNLTLYHAKYFAHELTKRCSSDSAEKLAGAVASAQVSKPQLLHVGAEARSVIRAWAEEEGVSVNAIMVSVLEQFFKRLKKSKALREELRLELRARRGFLPS
jgi:hypothetical protein